MIIMNIKLMVKDFGRWIIKFYDDISYKIEALLLNDSNRYLCSDEVLFYLCMTENDFVIHKTYFMYIFPQTQYRVVE